MADSATPVVFATCLVELVQPALAGRVAALVGGSVARGTTCCGQPAWNAGYVGDARRVASRTQRALARTDGPIVVPSGSCTAMMRHYWSTLLPGDTVGSRAVELSEYLALRSPEPSPTTRGVAYHDSCHMLRVLGIKDAPRQVLAAAGCAVREMPGAERCCGFGGTFSVKLPEVSTAMADEKLDEVMATGASTLVGCDVSCLMHLEGRARRRNLNLQVRHLADMVDGP